MGLGQGLNVQSIVQTLTQAAQANDAVYTNQQTALQNQTSALNNVSSLLTSLQLAAQTLQDPAGPLAARAANSSNSSVVTATASSSAATGSYSVVVTNLASTSTWIAGDAKGNALASGDKVFGTSGTITIQVGGASGKQLSINIGGSNDTLNSLASYINSSAQNPGVTASVVTDANGARLALTSNQSGAPGEISVTASVPGLSFSEAVQGKNAGLSVNGVPVASSTNVVTGVVPGVTFDLAGLNTASSPASVTVTQDATQASAAINSFVSAYNAVAQAINAQFTYTAGASSQPALFSDSSLQQVQSTLANDINYAVQGNSGISGLASIGVSLQQDGTLSVDNTALSAALSSNPAAVQTFFQGPNYTTGFAGQFFNDINKLNDPTNGVIALDLQGINSQEQDVTQIINNFNANLLLQEQQWTTEYSQVNATLQQLPTLLQQIGAQVNTSSSASNTLG